MALFFFSMKCAIYIKNKIKVMAEIVKSAVKGIPLYMWLLLGISASLLITGFLVPPMGVIDGSVLQGVSILLGAGAVYSLLANLPTYIEKGAKVRANLSATGLKVEMGNEEE